MVLKCLSILSAAAALSVVLKHAAASAFTMRRSVALCSFFLISYINKYHPLLFLFFFLPSLPIFPFSPEAGAGVSLEEGAGFLSFHELSELMQALPGFLMLLTGEGKFLYLSESVSEHLGHSMVSLHTVSALAVQQSRVWDS